MFELIKFETSKLLRKPIILASLAGTLFFMILMECSWVAPGYASVQESQNGQRIVISGYEAIERNQQIAALYSGPATDELIETIVDTYDMEDSFWEENGLDPYRERNYAHNLLYGSLSRLGFIKMDGSYSGVTLEEVFGSLAPNLVLGYSDGWECTIYLLMYTLMLWGCVVIVIVTPIFSEEYTRHMDAPILTGKKGRKTCSRAKIISAFLVAMAGAILILAAATLIMLVVHGTTGYDSSVQLGELGILKGTPYPLSWLQAYGLSCIAWVGGTLVVTALALVISALAKNSFSALIITFVIYTVPLFLPWNSIPEPLQLFSCLLPINQMQLTRLFRYELFQLGGLTLAPVWLALPVTLVVLAAGIPYARRTFARHQVV